MKIAVNEYGTPVAEFVCKTCGKPYTVCPVPKPRSERAWENCLAPECPSYDPKRDADKLFEQGVKIERRSTGKHN